MMKNDYTIFVDTREPSELLDIITRRCIKENFNVKIESKLLEIFDLQLVLGDIILIGVEIKRIYTKDFQVSLYQGKIKKQLEPSLKMECFKMFAAVGDVSDLPAPAQKALETLKMELNLLGMHGDTFHEDYLLAYAFVQACQFIIGRKPVHFKAYVNPTRSDDSVLTKMLKQFVNEDNKSDKKSVGFGDDTAEKFGKNNKNFLQVFFNDVLIEEIRTMLPSTTVLDVSNKLREWKGNKPQNKPLKVVEEFIEWFFKQRGKNDDVVNEDFMHDDEYEDFFGEY